MPTAEPTPAPEQPTAAALIDALIEEAEAVDEGQFSFDAVAAAEKLDAYAYGDRSQYLLPMVEAAHILGASEIHIGRVGAGADLFIECAGIELEQPKGAFYDLFAHALATPSERGQRALARLGVGLHMALGHSNIERIALTYTHGGERVSAVYQRGQQPTVMRAPSVGTNSLWIYVDRPWIAGMVPGGPARTELGHLREALRHSPRRLLINSERVSGQALGWDPEFRVQGEAAGLKFECAFTVQSSEPSRIELWAEDMRVDTLPGQDYCFVARVMLDAPRRDLSRMKVVHDDALKTALEAVGAAQQELRAKLREAQLLWGESDRPENWWPKRIELALGESEPTGAGVRAVKAVGGSVFGGLFCLGGTVAGAVGVGLLASGQIAGLFALIFLFSHGLSGASIVAKAWSEQPSNQELLKYGLFTVLCVLAILGGLVGKSLL